MRLHDVTVGGFPDVTSPPRSWSGDKKYSLAARQSIYKINATRRRMVRWLLIFLLQVSVLLHLQGMLAQHVRQNSNNALGCYRSTMPETNPDWTRDGIPFLAVSRRVTFVGHEIVFNPLLPEDEGSYSCGDQPWELLGKLTSRATSPHMPASSKLTNLSLIPIAKIIIYNWTRICTHFKYIVF